MVLVPDLLPGNKTEANSNGPVSLNLLDGSNWNYPEADVDERAAIHRHHLLYTQGLLYFLVTYPGVPRHISTKMRRWGLCVDEFVDTGGWPHQLYVREGRRLVGEHVLTESDVAGGAIPWRRHRRRALQHRHPRSAAHLGVPGGVQPHRGRVQRG